MNIEKKYFYILKLKEKNFIKIGVSDFVYSRIESHHNTYGVDFDNSYIVSSNNDKIQVLFELEFLAYFEEYRNFSLKPLDGYTEILNSDCIERIIGEINLRRERFPDKNIVITKGINLPSDIISREKKWEELLFKLKVYRYYPTGINSLLNAIKTFNVQLTSLKRNQKDFSFESIKKKLKLSWDDTFIRIAKERAKLGLIYPFELDFEYYQPILEELESIEQKIRLDYLGLEELHVIILGILTMLSNEEYPQPKFRKFKSSQLTEINMMKRSLKPSNRFLSWEMNIDESATQIDLLEEYFSFRLYEDSIQIKD